MPRIKTDGDLSTSQKVVDKRTEVVAKPRPQRTHEQYNGRPSTKDGKFEVKFPTTEQCNILDEGDKCDEMLFAYRVKKETNIRVGNGGYLEYDQKKAKYWLFCEVHGPNYEPPQD